jgi:hypothetical protein
MMESMAGLSQLPPQKLQEPGAQQVDKPGASKFDGVLADKAQAAGGPEPLHAVQSTREVQPPAPAERGLVAQVIRGLEQGQMDLERLIQAGASGRRFSNAELLSLQASLYKYTQELDLTSKVVEKATSGLRDIIKTQV